MSSTTEYDLSPETTARNLKIRDNQRRSRARKKEYLKELEQRLRRYEVCGAEASVAIQYAARKVVDENKMLRDVLHRHGIGGNIVESYLQMTRSPSRLGSPNHATTGNNSAGGLERLLVPRQLSSDASTVMMSEHEGHGRRRSSSIRTQISEYSIPSTYPTSTREKVQLLPTPQSYESMSQIPVMLTSAHHIAPVPNDIAQITQIPQDGPYYVDSSGFSQYNSESFSNLWESSVPGSRKASDYPPTADTLSPATRNTLIESARFFNSSPESDSQIEKHMVLQSVNPGEQRWSSDAGTMRHSI
ncbi:hypothetical protein BJ170DRAFT_680143 [Xylariales sp. AK1849]|nr:hypothetical protein BJ170DRAFT_680143 [Xylariales sp. AK1849]